MKTLIIATLLVSFSAQASYFQEFCSDAKGTIRTASGHEETYVKLAKLDDNSILEYSVSEVRVETTEHKQLSSTSSNNCDLGGTTGVIFWSTINTEKIVITKADGSTFPEYTIGVSDDRKSITTYVICNHSGNGMMLCSAQ